MKKPNNEANGKTEKSNNISNIIASRRLIDQSNRQIEKPNNEYYNVSNTNNYHINNVSNIIDETQLVGVENDINKLEKIMCTKSNKSQKTLYSKYILIKILK